MPARARVTLCAVWCCFLVRAVFYCSVLPLWEGYDEYSHFAVIRYIAVHPGLPDPRTSNSPKNVADSLKLTPAAWILHDRPAGRLSYEEYWAQSEGERQRLKNQLLKLPQSLAHEFADPVLPLYEAQQPPLTTG
jgi:hypothetical protein